MEAEKWIIDWFIKERSIQKSDLINNFDKNYFDLGYIDSLSFVTLLVDIEADFNIEFDNDDFVDGTFFTLKGVIHSIDTKMSKEII